MKRIVALLAVAALLGAGAAVAQDMQMPTKEAEGTVKTIVTNVVTVTDKDGKDWAFTVDAKTKVIAKGATHATADAQAEGKPLTIADVVKTGQKVKINYHEMEGKMVAAEIRVL